MAILLCGSLTSVAKSGSNRSVQTRPGSDGDPCGVPMGEPADEVSGAAVRVLVSTAARVYGEALASALDREPGIDVVAAAVSPSEAAATLSAVGAEVVVTSSRNAPVIAELLEVRPELNVVVLAVDDSDAAIVECVEAGATAFALRDASLSEVVQTIRTAATGEPRCSPRATAALMRRVRALAVDARADTANGRLTLRETEIVNLIADGLSNKEIALNLRLEVATVKNHVHNILEKLRVKRRSEAVAVLHRHSRAVQNQTA